MASDWHDDVHQPPMLQFSPNWDPTATGPCAPIQVPPPNTTRIPTSFLQHHKTARYGTMSAKGRDLLRQHTYTTDKRRRKLLLENRSPTCSAGWLIPDDPADGKLMFIADAPDSIVTHLQALLPSGVVSDAAWKALFGAISHRFPDLAEGETPPSAQKPAGSGLLAKRSTANGASGTPAAKRVRTVVEEDDPGTSEEDDDLDTEGLLEQIVQASQPDNNTRSADNVVYKVSSNIRRTMRKQEKRKERREENRKESIGLIKPKPNATPSERKAYATVSREDERLFAWIFNLKVETKEGELPLRFWDAMSSPYETATSLLQKARLAGGDSAWEDAADFIKTWRRTGTPFKDDFAHSLASTQVKRTSAAVLYPWNRESPSPTKSVDKMLRFAFDMADHFEKKTVMTQLQYRWAMAFLGYTYAKKRKALEEEDEQVGRHGGRRHGKGHRASEALRAVYNSLGSMSMSYERFKERVNSGNRWWEAAETLSWIGILGIPCASKSWVEREVRAKEWRAWLQIVLHINPDMYAAGKAFEGWLGTDGIEGGSLNGKEPLQIESRLALGTAVNLRDEEVHDDVDLTTQESQYEREPKKPLRQLKLTDLFKPQRQLSSSSSQQSISGEE